MPPLPTKESVYRDLNRRTNISAPNKIDTDDKNILLEIEKRKELSEDSAVSIALRNNAAFQELLVDLKIARSDLIQAGLLPNPELAYTFGVSNKPFKYLLDLPIEAIWLRPIRMQIAKLDSEINYQRLLQAGLILIRDVRQSYAEQLLFREKLEIADESMRIREEISNLSQIRKTDGDISEQEAVASTVDAISAKNERDRIKSEASLASLRFYNLLGIPSLGDFFTSASRKFVTTNKLDCQPESSDWIEKSLQSRPDIQAANIAVASAEERLKLSGISWFRLLGIADATSGNSGHVLSPAGRFTLPVLNQNQGGTERARAELERAQRKLETTTQQVTLEVANAITQYRQTCAEWDLLSRQLLPAVESSMHMARKAYEDGTISYLTLLESDRHFVDSSYRQAQIKNELFKIRMEIERNIGSKSLPTAVFDPDSMRDN